MVNTAATGQTLQAERHERDRSAAAGVIGQAKLHPFGDLHTLQHLCARLAKPLRHVFEPVLRDELRGWAEPLSVQRFADYRAERGDALTAWLPLAMPGGQALLVLDGRFVLELLDLFFGGTGVAPQQLPAEFPASAEALVARLGGAIAGPLAAAWEPLAELRFQPGRVETAPATLADPDDALVVTRVGLAGQRPPAYVDILYPVSALKPHVASLTGRVLDKAEPDAQWRHGLTRAAMAVRFPVRSVLAEPVVPLSVLMNLKVGDVIPISFGADVPVVVGRVPLGHGTVGSSNGQAAIRLTQLAPLDEGLVK